MNAIEKNTKKEAETKAKKETKRNIKIKPNTNNTMTTMTTFVKQDFRSNVLENMFSNKHLSSKELFQGIMFDNMDLHDDTRQGWIFETICQILIITKCIVGLNFIEILDGQLQSLETIKNVKTLLNLKVAGGGNNVADIVIKNTTTITAFSIKYKNKFGETDVCKLDNTMKKAELMDYKIGLIVRDKNVIINHKFKNKQNIDKLLLDKINTNGLLFDETDIIKALDVFRDRFSDNNTLNINDFMEIINTDYLNSPREPLTLKLHQEMTKMKFMKGFETNKNKNWCIAHKPRSGKSITILNICKELLNAGNASKILIMTSVPATIKSFIDDLEKYMEFKDIIYKKQGEFDKIENDFKGIVFCSVQYLKMDGKATTKKELLKKIGFDVFISDEAHQGSSTEKTKNEILNNNDNDDDELNNDVLDIGKESKIKIFASGTADKTKRFYNINSKYVYEWEIEDEAHMKELSKLTGIKKDDVIEFMNFRHGISFTDCYNNEALNKDYSKHPTQVLMKHSVSKALITEIEEYNTKYGTKYGFNCGSLFALESYTENGIVKYRETFELCKDQDGIDILKGYFECIISKNKNNKTTIFKQIEHTQKKYESRQSCVEDPLLFIFYLPINTRNNTISSLQKAIKQFIEKYNLWDDYNIEYSNSICDSGNVKQEYNDYVETIMNNTKKSKKRGCILLLGGKGTVGITYRDCDVTISLDDGHNLDNQKQKFSRALTEGNGKTIGINVDMNIQRTYLYLNHIIQKHKRTMKSKMTNAEVLLYFYEHNIFLFDPNHFDGKMNIKDIESYYKEETEKMINEIDDAECLDSFVCDDTMREYIKMDFTRMIQGNREVNEDLEGDQKDCPKGEESKKTIVREENDDTTEETRELTEEETNQMIVLVNKTLEMLKTFLIPLLALLSRSYQIYDFKEIFTNEKTKDLVMKLICEKIDLKREDYNIIISKLMNTILNGNEEAINNIREIYSTAPSHKIRTLIEKHFIPTNEEKKKNAEVPTPVVLVDEMLNVIPVEFWTTPKTVFEPCCGKGNFILGIFDKFYNGLKETIPDEIERCKTIMSKCIYYGDLTSMNVFITTEILKCHIQSYTGLDELDYKFNSYTGDTLVLNVEEHFKVKAFDAVIGNPPYNASGAVATGNTIWQDFTKIALNKWIVKGGYLMFVHPSGWRKPNTLKGKFTKLFDLMTKENQMLYLEIHGIKDGQKVFKCGTRYDWYLIENSSKYKNTIVIDENSIHNEIDLSILNWLPNSNIEEVKKILAVENEEKCPIIQSMSAYEPRKKWMSHTKDGDFKYPCIHSTPKSGTRYMYSNVNNKGHFGISKVIFGDSGINSPIIDMEGNYGMTQHAMAIQIKDQEEGKNIIKAIQSEKFNQVIQSCSYSTYAIDWTIFREFKKDFWKEFVDEPKINVNSVYYHDEDIISPF